MAGGHDFLPYRMEHATFQSLMIRKPGLSGRESQHCLSSFNRGAVKQRNYQWQTPSPLLPSFWLGAISSYEWTLLSNQSFYSLPSSKCTFHFSNLYLQSHQPLLSRNSLVFIHCLAKGQNSVKNKSSWLHPWDCIQNVSTRRKCVFFGTGAGVCIKSTSLIQRK